VEAREEGGMPRVRPGLRPRLRYCRRSRVPYFRWHRAGEEVLFEVQPGEVVKGPQGGGEGPAEGVAPKGEVLEVGERAKKGGDGPPGEKQLPRLRWVSFVKAAQAGGRPPERRVE